MNKKAAILIFILALLLVFSAFNLAGAAGPANSSLGAGRTGNSTDNLESKPESDTGETADSGDTSEEDSAPPEETDEAEAAADTTATESSGLYYNNEKNCWEYTLVHEVTVSNNTDGPLLGVTVTVALADVAEPLYCQRLGEELSPRPQRIDTDGQGQRKAIYVLDRMEAGESLLLTQKYALNVYDTTYSVGSGIGAYTAEELADLELYLQEEDSIQSENQQIKEFAAEAISGKTDPYQIAHDLFSTVNLALQYSNAVQEQDALSALRLGVGDCEGYANLYIACLRSQGIPARAVSGYLYQPSQHFNADYLDAATSAVRLSKLRHMWVEFYLPNSGWVIADPTFTYTYEANGSIYKFIDWSYFAQAATGRRYVFLAYGDPTGDGVEASAVGGQPTVSIRPILKMGHDYLPFADLAGHWAREAATYNIEQGYFNGVSDQAFAPNLSMTRAMFVTVLGRLYQARGGVFETDPFDAGQFIDVNPASYYAPALSWCLDKDLIDGYGNGKFGPNDPVTREQMAKIISAFVALLQQEDLTTASIFPAQLSFSDRFTIALWAQPGVALCVGGQLITGYSDGSFQPRSLASRAEVAAILQRLDALLNTEQ